MINASGTKLVFGNTNEVHQGKTIIPKKGCCDDGFVKQVPVMNTANDAPLKALSGLVNMVNIKNSLPIQMNGKENQRSRSVVRQTVKTKKRLRSREPSRISLG